MDTRHLRAFVKITELGSISRAADEMGLTQPALSQQLLRLEDEIGFKLFERTARGVATTEEGRIFERYARQILESADRALEEVSQFKAEVRQRVTLAMPYSVSKLVGVALPEAAMERAPAVSLRIIEAFSGPVRSMVESGVVDLGLLYDVVPLSGLSVKRLAREELYVIGQAGHLPTGGAQIAVTEIAALPLILPAAPHGLRQFLDQEAQRIGIRLKVVSEIDSLQHIVGLVAEGRGFCLLPLSAVQREIESGALSAARVSGGAFTRTLCIVKRPDVSENSGVTAVETLSIDVLARLIAKRRWIAEPDVDLT